MSSSLSASPQQKDFADYYFSSDSGTYSNVYQSAIKAGYSETTARNLTHVRPKWLSDLFGQITIKPEEITATLTSVIHNPDETTAIRLKAIEMMMRFYKMYSSHSESTSINVNLDLSGLRLGTHYVASNGVRNAKLLDVATTPRTD